MGRERITIETDEQGHAQVSGGQLDGAKVITKSFTSAPLLVVTAVSAVGPDGQPGCTIDVQSPAGMSRRDQVRLLEAIATTYRAKLADESAPW